MLLGYNFKNFVNLDANALEGSLIVVAANLRRWIPRFLFVSGIYWGAAESSGHPEVVSRNVDGSLSSQCGSPLNTMWKSPPILGKMVSGISMTIVVEQFATIALITGRDPGNYVLVQIINILSA